MLYRVADGTATITLNRPEVLNAINGAMHRGILEGLEQAAGDDTVRVVVIRGSGRPKAMMKVIPCRGLVRPR